MASDLQSESTLYPPWWRVVVLAVVGLGLLAGLPYVKGLPPLVGTLVATIAFLLLTLLLIIEASRWPLWPVGEVAGLVVCLGLWWTVGELTADRKHLAPLAGGLSGMIFLGACIYFGRLLSLIIRERNVLLPVALIAGVADIFTVFFGPTGEALEKAPALVEKLSVAIPQIGSAAGPEGAAGLTALATAGLGDFIFLTFFFVGVCRYGLPLARTFWSILPLTALGMIAVLLLPFLPAVPLLPFIITGFLLANAREFTLSREEKGIMAVVLLLVTGLLVVAAVLLRAGGW
jgi:hypothetical protein